MLRKYGTGEVTGIEPTETVPQAKTAGRQDWTAEDETALQDETEE